MRKSIENNICDVNTLKNRVKYDFENKIVIDFYLITFYKYIFYDVNTLEIKLKKDSGYICI